MADGLDVSPVITHKFGIDQAEEAMRTSADPASGSSKVMLRLTTPNCVAADVVLRAQNDICCDLLAYFHHTSEGPTSEDHRRTGSGFVARTELRHARY
jgi:hypothetical protein